MKTISCNAPLGSGGLGRHVAQLVEDARADHTLLRHYTAAVVGTSHDNAHRTVESRLGPWISNYTHARFNPGTKAWLSGELFDRAVSRALEPACTFVGFSGQALHTFQRARQLGYTRLELVSPTCHVDRVAERHAAARSKHPLESGWLNERLRKKCLAEYGLADVIHVTSEYARRSFFDAGVQDEHLRGYGLEPDSRFTGGGETDGDLFRIVYVGALTVTKGVPVLIEAFERFDDPTARLTLVGGWSTRKMRRFLTERLARDPRIEVVQGDPLPYLHRADVYVHPSWQDGFGLAPAEALACGVPVVVSDDTGMKELIQNGVNGWIVPTGDAEAILGRLRDLRADPRRYADPC